MPTIISAIITYKRKNKMGALVDNTIELKRHKRLGDRGFEKQVNKFVRSNTIRDGVTMNAPTVLWRVRKDVQE